MDDCERLREIQAVVDDIAGRAMRGAIILVEGPRDRDSLEALGVRGYIVLASRRRLFSLAENIARPGGDVIVMTDWDERGEEVAKAAERYLKANGSRPDLEPRKKLRRLTRKEVMDVESLHGYVERLRQACALKPQHY